MNTETLNLWGFMAMLAFAGLFDWTVFCGLRWGVRKTFRMHTKKK